MRLLLQLHWYDPHHQTVLPRVELRGYRGAKVRLCP